MTKRRAEGDFEAVFASPSQQQIGSSSASPFAKRSSLEYATRTASSDAAAPIELARQVDIQAYGLEDRSEAVIAMGKSNWTLANLSKWRNDSFASVSGDSAVNNAAQQNQQSMKEYLRQRQRAYMKQCLAANKAPAASHQ